MNPRQIERCEIGHDTGVAVYYRHASASRNESPLSGDSGVVFGPDFPQTVGEHRPNNWKLGGPPRLGLFSDRRDDGRRPRIFVLFGVVAKGDAKTQHPVRQAMNLLVAGIGRRNCFLIVDGCCTLKLAVAGSVSVICIAGKLLLMWFFD